MKGREGRGVETGKGRGEGGVESEVRGGQGLHNIGQCYLVYHHHRSPSVVWWL